MKPHFIRHAKRDAAACRRSVAGIYSPRNGALCAGGTRLAQSRMRPGRFGVKPHIIERKIIMKTEKISVNLSTTELGQIDLLVERGRYDSRSDFMRTAARKLIENHPNDIKQFLEPEHLITDSAKLLWSIGIAGITKKEVEIMIANGQKANIRCIGMFSIPKSVSADEIKQVILSCKVRGKLIASDEVKAAIREIEELGN